MVALLVNPDSPQIERTVQNLQEAAHAKGLQLPILKANSESEIDAAFTTLAQLQARALVVQGNPFFIARREELVALALRHSVPAIYEARGFIPQSILARADEVIE